MANFFFLYPVVNMIFIVFIIFSVAYGFVPPPLDQTIRHDRSTSKIQAASSAETEACAMFEQKHGRAKPGSYFFVEEKRRKSTFQVLAKIYGTDVALEMVRRNPSCLAYDSRNFSPSLAKFAETFGQEESKAMMLRNPNLLAVPPEGYQSAEKAGKETLYLSYVVEATRPLGPILLFLLFSFLATPAVESISGIPIRSIIFSQ
eukprot:CAMPEP_0197329038 /NCGR_PEP_ID=MMETSP0892-20130614/5377_1 /TAXON_ID=44058 ORGANISM="Aureoumbra lagunensis, Strain CCMP1510" /NCGR_SAMPLE_ID=MMETSP0892 /ASSEMBLY_ACC=CAM_ASM_000538 /LENGTH=202 /DNA_ID=CAMNT_0042825435 /DNA_START=2298 /DNA_END=2906 /DNA_ORIENTATION=+